MSRLLRILAFVGFACLVGMGIFSRRGWLDFRRMTMQNYSLQDKLVSLRQRKMELAQSLEAFRSEPIEKERVIRHVLGYVRPNELIVEYE